MPSQKLKIAIVGTSKRSEYMYANLIRGMADELELVAVWGRSEVSAARLATALGVPAYTDLAALVSEKKPDLAIVSVAYAANGEVALAAVEAGLSILTETPIAHDLAQADKIIATAARNGVKVEVAEQFHRRPLEQIKLKLIELGLFGRVHSSFNDFAGHGYHGVSVMRSYLGFDSVPVRVTGAVREFPLVAHYGMISGKTEPRKETQEHGMVEFSDGRLGVFHWTSVGYDSPLRWWRSSRFLAEEGMGVSIGYHTEIEERLTVLNHGGRGERAITIEREWERCDGGALVAVHAYTGDTKHPVVTWENPFGRKTGGWNPQWHDDEIGVAGCIKSLIDAVRTGGEPSYGARQARLDQEIILAIRASSANGGTPVEIPAS